MPRRKPPLEDRLLTQRAACAVLSISPRRFRTYFRRFEVLRAGIVPVQPEVGGEIFYRVRMSALVSHIEQLGRGQHAEARPGPLPMPKRRLAPLQHAPLVDEASL